MGRKKSKQPNFNHPSWDNTIWSLWGVLYTGAMEADLVYLSVILVLTTVVSYWYYLRVAWFMWMGDSPAGTTAQPIYLPVGMRLALITGVILILYLGVFPGATMDLARSSVAGLPSVGPALFGLAP